MHCQPQLNPLMNSRSISIALLVGLMAMAAVPVLWAQELTATSEIIATKLRADGFTFKSRASANLILMSSDDPAAWQVLVPDSVSNNGRAYPVKQICDSVFSQFSCMHQLSLPHLLGNVSLIGDDNLMFFCQPQSRAYVLMSSFSI